LEIGSDGITVNGRALAPRTADDAPARCAGDPRDVTVPADSFYVLGDNFCNSRDSRHFGPVPFSTLRGKVALAE
jgi:signal peptidase I